MFLLVNMSHDHSLLFKFLIILYILVIHGKWQSRNQ
jgi:hypothetical protein